MAFRSVRTRPPKKPATVSEEPKATFTVIKFTTAMAAEAEAAPLPRVSVRGVHPTEEQAHMAAILELVYDMEASAGSTLPKVRAIAKTATLPLKDRLKSIQSCGKAEESEERAEFVIKKAHAFPEGALADMEASLEAPLLPCAYWDSSDEEDYDPAEEAEEDDDDVEDDEDDDMADLVNEDEVMQGIEGSGGKEEEEEEEEEKEKKDEKKDEEKKDEKKDEEKKE